MVSETREEGGVAVPTDSELHTIELHGSQVAYRTAGEAGPVLLLVHGMAGSSDTWLRCIDDLSRNHRVVAPDLVGHGVSDKPRGDYSLGAQASTLRDLLAALGHDRATVVGQSLGGGIAMQFAYQYPERVERLVLVSAGGLGDDVAFVLRALTAPGVDLVLPVAFQSVVRTGVETVTGWFGHLGLRPSPATVEVWRSYTSLIDGATRRAFLHTLRSVVDVRGQRVSAADRLHLAAHIPTLIIWGDADPIIPVSHAHTAADLMPGSELVIMEDVGHYPHCERPRRFAELVSDFVSRTDPADLDPDQLRSLAAARST